MSEEHIDWLRPRFEQFARGDFSAYSDLPDDFELVLAREMPDAGSYRGTRLFPEAGPDRAFELAESQVTPKE